MREFHHRSHRLQHEHNHARLVQVHPNRGKTAETAIMTPPRTATTTARPAQERVSVASGASGQIPGFLPMTPTKVGPASPERGMEPAPTV